MNSEGAFVGAASIDLKSGSLKDHDVKEEDEDEAEREDAKQMEDDKDDVFEEDDAATVGSANSGIESKQLEDNKENKLPAIRLMRGMSQMDMPTKRE